MKILGLILLSLSLTACGVSGSIEELGDELASNNGNTPGAHIINIGLLPGAGGGEVVTTLSGYKISASVNGDIKENVLSTSNYKIEGVVIE